MEIEVATPEEIREECERNPEDMRQEILDQMKQTIKLGKENGRAMKREQQLYKDMKNTHESQQIADKLIDYMKDRGLV